MFRKKNTDDMIDGDIVKVCPVTESQQVFNPIVVGVLQ